MVARNAPRPLLSPQAAVFWTRVRQLQEEDFSVNVTVIGVTKGGLLVKYGPVEGFVPMKQFGTVSESSSSQTLRSALCCAATRRASSLCVCSPIF